VNHKGAKSAEKTQSSEKNIEEYEHDRYITVVMKVRSGAGRMNDE
jgi:hypothetical protein